MFLTRSHIANSRCYIVCVLLISATDLAFNREQKQLRSLEICQSSLPLLLARQIGITQTPSLLLSLSVRYSRVASRTFSFLRRTLIVSCFFFLRRISLPSARVLIWGSLQNAIWEDETVHDLLCYILWPKGIVIELIYWLYFQLDFLGRAFSQFLFGSLLISNC